AACLLRGAAGKEADGVRSPLGKDRFDGMAETCTICEKQDDSSNAPCHTDHGDGGTAAIVKHRFPGLAENVSEHRNVLLASAMRPLALAHSLRNASIGSRAAA